LPTSTGITMGDVASTNDSEGMKITLKTILKDLLAKERRSHILTIVILAPTLYVLSQKNIITPNISAIAFLSLMGGYCILALMGLNENTRQFIEKNVIASKDTNQSIKNDFQKNIISTIKIISIPMLISGILFLILSQLLGENSVFSMIGDFLPVFLASLFIFWSFSQAISYKNSVGLWIDEKINLNSEEVNYDLKKNSIIQLSVVGVSITIISSFMLSFFGDESGLNSTKGVPIVVLIALLSQGFILWYSKDSRADLMKRKDGQKIDFLWGIALHLFASWHLLSIYRRFVSTGIDPVNIIEEIILMIFTVVMSIWSISSKGMSKNYNLFVSENVLFWGIAFGFGYAGSVTMLAVGLSGDITSIFAIGHFVTWVALLSMHKQSCKDILTSRL